MIKLFQSFLAKMKAGFLRISRATKNEMTVDDLHNDAWVIALEIGDRRGRPIDFSDPEDQELVMKAVNVQNVRRGDWNMRRSVRIDQEPERDENGDKWVERLPAHVSSDPLVALLAQESAIDTDAMLAASYSQATAYAITFHNFRSDRQKICTYLVISDGMLVRRVNAAADTVRLQPSMFDRIERIPSSFMPLRGREYVTATEDRREVGQWAWDFEAAL